MILALILFAVTYVLMLWLQPYRPWVALCSAAAFILLGEAGVFAFSLPAALQAVDYNVLLMMAGTMGTVALFIESKMPARLAEMLIVRVPDVRWAVCMLALFAGFISAFVDNVATVLMVAPVALALCKKLHISPVPAIICIAISSNLQGAATLVGDTTSILLAKAAGLDFMDFFFVDGKPGMFWVTECGALLSALIILWFFRKENAAIRLHDRTPVEDKGPTWLLYLTIASLIAVSFIPYQSAAQPGQFYKLEITNGLICMFFFVIGLIREVRRSGSREIIGRAVLEIDFYTLSLLAGLFVVIGGISRAGIIDLLGTALAGISGDGSRGSIFIVYSVIVWMSVLCSAFIDNIPYTATMLPVVAVVTERLSAAGGLAVEPNLMYFGLLVGATLGGNLTPIGASANIAGIGILRKEGYSVSSGTFMKFGVPFTLAAVISGYLLVWLIWM